MLFATLEGLVNRRRPRLYLIQSPREDERGRLWLRHLDVPFSVLENRWQLFARFPDAARGTIVYDPAVPATVNVATTLAGLEDAVVTPPNLAPRLESRYELRVLGDLRDRFRDAMDAYTWQFQKLWPHTRHDMLISLPPRRGRLFGTLRDYAVANRAMVSWLDPMDPAERDLFERILSEVQPGSVFLGWFPCCGDREWSGVELLSTRGVITFAADSFQNMTVFSARCCRTLSDAYVVAPPPLQDRIYVTFTFSDGDNLAFDQNTMRGLWANPDRGRVPMNWTISPALLDAAPAILRYYRQTATPNDLLVAGVSGLGYIYPTPWPNETFRRFTQLTGRYLRQAGFDIVWVFNVRRGQPAAMSPAEIRAYVEDVDPRGMMLISEPGVGLVGGTTPRSSVLGATSAAGAQAAIADASAGWDHRSPLFLSVQLYAWDTSPSDVVEIANSLGPKVVVVRADQYFELIREASTKERAPALAVTASRSDETSPPELAVDGNGSTLWNAGAFAPQWIEVDLGRPRSIEGISLLTAQSPRGRTVHRILGKLRSSDRYRVLHTFTGVTRDLEWLDYTPPRPWDAVRFLRVETTQSPSWVAWREIRLQLERAA